jgi:hypothetical protein
MDNDALEDEDFRERYTTLQLFKNLVSKRKSSKSQKLLSYWMQSNERMIATRKS